MSQPSAYEQYMLELINQERAQAGVQPLAFNGDLNEAAELHSQWMIATDTFSHTGSGGSTPGERMSAAGYSFTGSWSWGENIAWATTRFPAGLQDEVDLLNTNLMNSSGHRANILNANFKEIGIGFEVGDYGGHEGAFVTEDFAKSGSATFLTGVAFDDKDGDRFYDPGEGLGGISVTITTTSGAVVASTTTMDAGGYEIALTAGTYNVTFSGGGVATSTQQVSIGSSNLKVDLVDPVMTGSAEPPPPPPELGTIVGTASSESLYGTSGNDNIQGLGGSDRLYGYAGNDTLEGGDGSDYLSGGSGDDVLTGGAGNDYLYGGSGNDVLTGGPGADRYTFNTSLNAATNVDQIPDFSVVDDTIRLENAIFTTLTSTGPLASSAFYIGPGAHDATDRIIYDPGTGALMYDPDGTGAAPAVTFAQLATGLALTNADFLVI